MFCPFVSEDIVSYISKARSVWYFTWNSFILKSIVQSYNGDMTHIYKSGVIYFYLVEKVYILPISGVIWDQMILQNEMCLSAIMLWVHVIMSLTKSQRHLPVRLVCQNTLQLLQSAKSIKIQLCYSHITIVAPYSAVQLFS